MKKIIFFTLNVGDKGGHFKSETMNYDSRFRHNPATPMAPIRVIKDVIFNTPLLLITLLIRLDLVSNGKIVYLQWEICYRNCIFVGAFSS